MIFQEVNWIRTNANKFCPILRKQALEWYKPFRFVPCFLQKYFKAVRHYFKKVPIIVQIEAPQELKYSIGTLAKISGCKIRREIPLVNSFSTKVNAKTLARLIGDNTVKKVWFDGKVRAILDTASQAVKAPMAWNINKTGEGVGVAVIDTGIYPHQDLAGRIVAFKDFVSNKTSAYDDNGHGTHVAGDIASNGSQSDSLYRGTAPGADLIGVKVLNKLGSGNLSTVMDGIQWCIDNKASYGIRVINLSLGSTANYSFPEDPVCQIVERAWEHGIVVCAAAGNEGPEARTIASPGIDPLIITVGAIDNKNSMNFNDYEVANYSSRGPTTDNITKPDLVCPGTNIISLRSPNSTLDKQNKSSRVGRGYISMSGTSMATPVCAGIVALILEANSYLRPDDVKQILRRTAKPLTGATENIQGKGLVDVEAAIKSL